mgnify:CR=1 FL=1
MTTSSSINILNAKKFLKKYSIEKYKPEGNSNIYLAAQTKSIGFFLLKKIFKIKKKNFFENLIYIFADITFGLNYSVKLIKPKKLKQNFSRIVLSWGNKKDLDNRGNFYDKYFNTQTSKKKKILWLIIYMDKNLPKKIQSNIIILKIKGNKILNIFNWLKFLVLNTPKIFKNFDYFLINISSFNYLSKRIIFSLRTILIKNFKEIIIPYEGQPFQNEIIRFLKNKNDKVIVTGYIHSSPLSTPTNFIHKQFCPDRIFLNGKDQLFCFEKMLSWLLQILFEIAMFQQLHL